MATNKLKVYDPAASCCPKCGFPATQMYRVIANEGHSIMVGNEVGKCPIKGEHLHLECACGHELTLRAMDWVTPTKKTTKAKQAPTKVAKKPTKKKVVKKPTKKVKDA